jgi:hypothetical protein
LTAGDRRDGVSAVSVRTARPSAVLAAVALALALVGCDDELTPPSPIPSAPGTPAPATPAAPASSSAPSRTPPATAGTTRSPIQWFGPAPSGGTAAVALAVRRYWSMVVRLAEKPDPDDPDLTALALDPQLATLVKVFAANQESGVTQRGPILATATVRSVRGATAESTTCLDQTFVKVYERSGRVRPGSSGGRDPFVLSLRRDGGAWKVFRASGGSGTCSIPR